ncbi:MAG: hypothetical protein ACI4GD_08835 [Lachnospiraceae bacterium]
MKLMEYFQKLRKQFENWKFKKILRKMAKKPIVVSQHEMINGPIIFTHGHCGKVMKIYSCDEIKTSTEFEN